MGCTSAPPPPPPLQMGPAEYMCCAFVDDHENIVRMETFRSAAKMDWVAEDKSTYALGRIGLR